MESRIYQQPQPVIYKLNFMCFDKNNFLHTGPEKPSLAVKATCSPLTGETSRSGR